VSHPINTGNRCFLGIAQEPDIDLTVFLRLDFSVRDDNDEGFGLREGNVPLSDGYRHEFLLCASDNANPSAISPLEL